MTILLNCCLPEGPDVCDVLPGLPADGVPGAALVALVDALHVARDGVLPPRPRVPRHRVARPPLPVAPVVVQLGRVFKSVAERKILL